MSRETGRLKQSRELSLPIQLAPQSYGLTQGGYLWPNKLSIYIVYVTVTICACSLVNISEGINCIHIDIIFAWL